MNTILKNLLRVLPLLALGYLPNANAAPDYRVRVPMAGLVVLATPADGDFVEGVAIFDGFRARPDGSFASSCAKYRNQGYSGATGDGTYRIQLPGQAPFDVWCDMASDGGGWTRVVRQSESSPVTWTGGTSGSSYSLSSNQIPQHTQIGFGKDNLATDVDYVVGTYSTGNIVENIVTSPKTGIDYHISRNSTYYHGHHHDPEGGRRYASPNGNWLTTLSLDRVGVTGLDWSFSPLQQTFAYRGYAYKGEHLYYTVDDFSWTVWVR